LDTTTMLTFHAVWTTEFALALHCASHNNNNNNNNNRLITIAFQLKLATRQKEHFSA